MKGELGKTDNSGNTRLLNNKTLLLIVAFYLILTSVMVGGCSSKANSAENEEKIKSIADAITKGVIVFSENLNETKDEWEGEAKQAEAERLAKLGYPEGYDPNNPVANGEFTEDDWAALQQEEAMNSMAEDAMQDYYRDMYEGPPDPLFD